MKIYIAALTALFVTNAFAVDAPVQSSPVPADGGVHRYMIERTFPAGALDGLDASVKAKVNANNSSVGVTWEQSYANESKTKTFCVYDGPSEAAVRKAAILNGLPIDRVTEVPLDLDPGAHAMSKASGADNHRFIVERTFTPGEIDGLTAASKAKISATNARFGVMWVKSYSNAEKTKTYAIYEAPNQIAVRSAASANGIPVASVTEVPVTLLPN
jgi:Protein of unknown function (DUF4242)